MFGTCSAEAVAAATDAEARGAWLRQARGRHGAARELHVQRRWHYCIYLTIATVFIAQATSTPLGWADQVVVLAVLMLTSKGSAGVAGAGFVTLAATLSTMSAIPVAGAGTAARRRSLPDRSASRDQPDRRRCRDGRDQRSRMAHSIWRRPGSAGATQAGAA